MANGDILGAPPAPWEYPDLNSIAATTTPTDDTTTTPTDIIPSPNLLDGKYWYAPLTYGGTLHV